MTSVSAINEWMKRLCYLHLKAVFILSTVTLIYVNSCALHLYQAIPSLYAREYFLCVDFNVILALASRSVIYRVQIVCAHRFSSLFPGEPGSWVDARWTFFFVYCSGMLDGILKQSFTGPDTLPDANTTVQRFSTIVSTQSGLSWHYRA